MPNQRWLFEWEVHLHPLRLSLSLLPQKFHIQWVHNPEKKTINYAIRLAYNKTNTSILIKRHGKHQLSWTKATNYAKGENHININNHVCFKGPGISLAILVKVDRKVLSTSWWLIPLHITYYRRTTTCFTNL